MKKHGRFNSAESINSGNIIKDELQVLILAVESSSPNVSRTAATWNQKPIRLGNPDNAKPCANEEISDPSNCKIIMFNGEIYNIYQYIYM